MQLGLGLSLTNLRGGGFSPALLFAAGEQGAWYDPSDITTLFQDDAGTTPVTAPGQSVGLMLDKSGRGNHATQANLAQRPIYAREPLTGRRNLLTFTEQFDNAAWIDGGSLNGTRSAGSITITSAQGFFYLRQNGAFNNVIDQTLSFDVVCDQTVANVGIRAAGDQSSAIVVNLIAGVPQRVTLSAFRPFPLSVQFGVDMRGVIIPGVNTTASGFTVTFNRAQLELGSTATAYQRVGNNFDVTEAGVPELQYLAFDGSDDGMVTGNINPGTIDKAQVFAGVRKLSDAAIGLPVEYSTNATSVSGTFYLAAPLSLGAAGNYSFFSKGNTGNTPATSGILTAPRTNVLTGLGDISAPSTILRVDGTQAASNTATQGTGNYLTYPLFIGRRGGASLPFNGRIYGLLVRFGANLSTAQIDQAEAFMAAKTGVTIP
jgi:hypothetical protein